jgi:hypothetical protein
MRVFEVSCRRNVQVSLLRDGIRGGLHCSVMLSHPRVLWTASKEIVAVTDLRASTSTTHTPIKLFDISGISSPLAEIYDLKRRSR